MMFLVQNGQARLVISVDISPLVAALLIAGMTILVSSRAIYHPILSPFAKISKLEGIIGKGLRLLDTGRILLQPGPFLVGTAIAIVAWGCEGWAYYLLLRSVGLAVAPVTSCSIFSITTVVGALSALPGGVGSFEVVMVLLLSRLGVPVSVATLPVVLFRFCTLWLTSFIGLLFLIGWAVFVSRGGGNTSVQSTN